MAAAEAGLTALAVKWGGWALGFVTTGLLAVGSFIMKEKNETIKRNTEISLRLSQQVTQLSRDFQYSNQIIEELSAQVTHLSEVKDKVLVLEVESRQMKEDVHEMKEDQKAFAKDLREYLTNKLNNRR